MLLRESDMWELLFAREVSELLQFGLCVYVESIEGRGMQLEKVRKIQRWEIISNHSHRWTKPFPLLHPHPSHSLCLTSSLDPIFPHSVIHPYGHASYKKLTGQQVKWDFPRNLSLSKDKVRLAGGMTICLTVCLF